MVAISTLAGVFRAAAAVAAQQLQRHQNVLSSRRRAPAMATGDTQPQLAQPNLLTPYHHLSGLLLKNRVVMAPLTRARGGLERTCNDWHVEHYAARASAGLIISEAVAICEQGHGWANAPALITDSQVAAWHRVTDAVHANGGLMSAQLWHADGSEVWHAAPRALSAEEIPGIVEEYRQGARRALEAGFDMVEVHSASGYLLDTFLQSSTNKRTDAYGGGPANRFRLVREVLEAVMTVFPAARIGIRLSPNGTFNSMGSPDNFEAFTYYIRQLNQFRLGWLHLVNGLDLGFHALGRDHRLEDARAVYAHPIMANCGYTKARADADIAAGLADAVSFGRPFISNPDLVRRFANNLPLSDCVPTSLHYATGPEGYIGVPTAAEEQAA